MAKSLQRPKLGKFCQEGDRLFLYDILYLDSKKLVAVIMDKGKEVEIIELGESFKITSLNQIAINGFRIVDKRRLRAPEASEMP